MYFFFYYIPLELEYLARAKSRYFVKFGPKYLLTVIWFTGNLNLKILYCGFYDGCTVIKIVAHMNMFDDATAN